MEITKMQEIARKYLDTVYKVAVNYCKDTQDASDAAQNAFLKLLQTDTVFADEEHIRKWLIVVTINECKGIWRSFWRRNVISLNKLTEENENHPALATNGVPIDTALLEAVKKLSPKYSIVIHLHYYEGYTVNEIAELLKLTPSNVLIRLMRARNKLKEQLKECYYDRER